eukprot:10537344-Alexandrium_andersonii.AAC.1
MAARRHKADTDTADRHRIRTDKQTDAVLAPQPYMRSQAGRHGSRLSHDSVHCGNCASLRQA